MLLRFLAMTTQEFVDKWLVIIVLSVMILAFIVIIVIAAIAKKKPTTYKSDEIDESVDKAAAEKAQLRVEEENNAEPEKQAVQAEESSTEVREQALTETAPEEATEEAADEDIDEEITFEGDDEGEEGESGNAEAPGKSEPRKRKASYRILYDRETKTWEIRKDNAKRVIRRVKTKKEALEIAQELSKNQELNLVVHKKDGKFQKTK